MENPCPPGKERNPSTNRCINICPPGKKRNPVTKRCIKMMNPPSAKKDRVQNEGQVIFAREKYWLPLMVEIQNEIRNSGYVYKQKSRSWERQLILKKEYLLIADSDSMEGLYFYVKKTYSDKELIQMYRSIFAFKRQIYFEWDYAEPFVQYCKQWLGMNLKLSSFDSHFDDTKIIAYFIPFIVFIEASNQLEDYVDKMSRILGVTFVSPSQHEKTPSGPVDSHELIRKAKAKSKKKTRRKNH